MDEIHFKRPVKIATCLLCLFLVGLAAALVIIAVNRNSLVVLLPFGLATLVSFGAVWWAYHSNGELVTSPPAGAQNQGVK